MFDEDYKEIPGKVLEESLVNFLRKLYSERGWESILEQIAPNTLEGKPYSVFSIKNLEYCLSCEHEHGRKRKSVVIASCLILDGLDIGLAGFCKECYRKKEDDIQWACEHYDSNTLNALYSDDEIKRYENNTKN